MLLIMPGESWCPRFLDDGSWSSRETMVVPCTHGGYDAKGADRPQHRGCNSTPGATRCVRTNARSNPGRNRDKDTVAEAIDMIVRDFVREMKGKPFESNALATRIISGDRLAGVQAFDDGGGILERVERLRVLFAGDTAKMKAVENAWLSAVATKKVAADANMALMEELAKYVFLLDGNADRGATLRNAQEVRKAALKLALANDVLVKMRDALNRIPVRQ